MPLKNIIITCLVAALLFAVSAGISLYLQGPASQPGAGKDKDAAKGEVKAGKEGANEKPARKSEDLPPLVTAPPASTNEQAARLLARLQEKEQALKAREEAARKQEGRLEIVLEDIRGERALLDLLRKQIAAELARLTDKQATVARKASGLEVQKKEAAKLLADMRARQIELEKGESTNLTKMASLADSMPPEKAAAVIKQLADSGKVDTAVKLLGQMKASRAAQVLAEITDAALAAQLLEKMLGLKRPTADKKDAG